jgi:D-inositol-3-phosphate glycosyltransferase
LRIVLIGPAHPLRGGIAQYNTSLAKTFLSNGDEVLVISYARLYPGIFFPGKTQEESAGEAFRVESEHLVDSINPLNWPRVARRIASFVPDLVIFQWWQPFFGPALQSISKHLKKLHSVPVIFLCHNLLSHECGSFPFRKTAETFLAKSGFRGADGFLVHSDQLGQSLARYAPGKPIAKIFHPLYDFYAEWDKVAVPNEHHDLQILFFGKIRRYKGLEILIEALGRLDRDLPFHAVFAGECYLPPENFRERIRELDIVNRVSWIDRYVPNEEIPELFRSADVLVLPYLSASQSGVIPVAYQFELPVIVSDVGGLSEVVKQGETGFLVKPGDPGELAEAITRFYNLQSRHHLKEGITAFRKKFTWESVVGQTMELYNEILKQGDYECSH